MAQYGLMINYEYCTGCHSCEFACRNEKNLSHEEWGIKMVELGPWKQGGKIEWNYMAIPTELCDVCKDRIAAGKKPACVHHCLAFCLDYGTIDELKAKLAEGDHKVILFVP